MMKTHIVDHRSGGDKTFASEQRARRKAKKLIQEAAREAVRTGEIGIDGVTKGGEISISRDGLDEPRIVRGDGGIRRRIFTGNKEFVAGDILERPKGGSGSGNNGPGSGAGRGSGQDAFRFMLTPEQFLDAFLADFELPDLEKKQLAQMEQDGFHRMGYARTGSPPSLSIKRTLHESKKRRIALKRPKKAELDALEREIEVAASDDERARLVCALERLKRKRVVVPFLDQQDLRYRRLTPHFRPSTRAVMFCLMDVSGSMNEYMKDLSKRFFMLLRIFLMRRYKQVEIVFIRHTHEAQEVDEKTFFYGIVTGGTVVSTAHKEMQKIIKERFPADQWNIYAAQASDGDNIPSDEQDLIKQLDMILPLTRYYAYLEVSPGDSGVMKTDSHLWTLYKRLNKRGKRIHMKKANHPSQIYPILRELFQRGKKDTQTKKGAVP